ncbi:MAG TPA: metallophosphoesterase [Humisphaera sp.]|nr:metallophosphoesterase [Humisphaera sp.]
MLVGILSDTHDRADMAASAIEILRMRGAEFYLHCGDVGGERVLDQLVGLPGGFVWGNNDWDRPELERYAAQLKITCYATEADITLAGKRFAMIHGDDFAAKRRIVESQEFDFLLLGHTHVRQRERAGRTTIINPGALYRAREKSVALLETETAAVDFLIVRESKFTGGL